MDIVFWNKTHLNTSIWANYFEKVYGIDTIQFPFNTSSLIFWYQKKLPISSEEYKITHSSLKYNNFFRMQNSPSTYLFRYIYPKMAGFTKHWSGIGRKIVAFIYDHGFQNHTKIEVIHTGSKEWQPNTGYWMYLAFGSGVYLDLGQTIVFPEHYDALSYFTGCHDKTCMPYINKIDLGGGKKGRLFRKIIYNSAKKAGFDTIQYTHRHEGPYRYEITDLRVRNPMNVCAVQHVMHSGFKGVRPCRCQLSRILNCGIIK